MARSALTGSRIRERRVMAGLKQTDLARQANISASYLNLIEHNRRRIGGKLLLDLARILDVEPTVLSEGAEATLIAALREAATGARGAAEVEIDRVDEFAGRFPGWANLLADGRRRIAALERTVETLSDRLTHDPHLAAALHEMLSTVTAIRSTASILVEPGDIPPDWQRRFHRNIAEDSARLAETSRSLVGYLEAGEDEGAEAGAPQEELDALLTQADHRFPALESGSADPADLAARLGAEVSPAARSLLARHLDRYAADAAALSLAPLARAVEAHGPDPFTLAGALAADPAQVMRRLAALPETMLPAPLGLAACDASGALSHRKPLGEFPMPRFGAGCPLWPLYEALGRPMTALRRVVAQPGDGAGAVFTTYALATPQGTPAPGRPPLVEAQMLIVPAPADAAPGALPVGVSCRICPRAGCPARREPSILSGAGAQEF